MKPGRVSDNQTTKDVTSRTVKCFVNLKSLSPWSRAWGGAASSEDLMFILSQVTCWVISIYDVITLLQFHMRNTPNSIW